jgi:hypothetical protein
MVRLLRIALQCVLALLLLGVAIAIGTSETGAVEKVALCALAGLLVYVAVLVRRSSVLT